MINDYIEPQLAMKSLIAKIEQATLRKEWQKAYDLLVELDAEVGKLGSWLENHIEAMQ